MREVLESVGIPLEINQKDILDVSARELSIGQKKRLSIARMMLDESEIVILDEPMAGIDIFTAQGLIPLMKKQLNAGNHTVLIISHNLAFGAHVDHILVMNEHGKIAEQGSAQELYERNELFARLYRTSKQGLDYLEIQD